MVVHACCLFPPRPRASHTERGRFAGCAAIPRSVSPAAVHRRSTATGRGGGNLLAASAPACRTAAQSNLRSLTAARPPRRDQRSVRRAEPRRPGGQACSSCRDCRPRSRWWRAASAPSPGGGSGQGLFRYISPLFVVPALWASPLHFLARAAKYRPARSHGGDLSGLFPLVPGRVDGHCRSVDRRWDRGGAPPDRDGRRLHRPDPAGVHAAGDPACFRLPGSRWRTGAWRRRGPGTAPPQAVSAERRDCAAASRGPARRSSCPGVTGPAGQGLSGGSCRLRLPCAEWCGRCRPAPWAADHGRPSEPRRRRLGTG